MLENVSTDVLLFIMGQLIVGAAIWGGIRMDIKHMHRRIDKNENEIDKAHTRIDQLFQVYWQSLSSNPRSVGQDTRDINPN